MRTNALLKCFSLFLAMVLLLGIMPFQFFATAAELEQSGEDQYVNLPQSGADTLDLTDKTSGFAFKIYDNGGAGGNYSNDCNGSLVITAPEGFVLKVSGSGYTENNYDYLYVYDGDTDSPLEDDSYCGTFTVNEAYSSENVLKVKFTSDYSENKQGFELVVTLIDRNSIAQVAYSYAGIESRSVVNKNTQITLPDFAELFTAPDGSTFLGWELGQTLYNAGDTFTVEDSVTFFAQVEEPPVVFGNDTDGWYANMPVTDIVTADLCDRQSGFSLHVYDNGGSTENYSDRCSGYMRIVAPADCILRISGAGETESGYDGLKIYDNPYGVLTNAPEFPTQCYIFEERGRRSRRKQT